MLKPCHCFCSSWIEQRVAARISASDKGHANIEHMLSEAEANPTFRYISVGDLIRAGGGYIQVAHMLLKVANIPNLKGVVNGTTTLVHACDQAHTEIVYMRSEACANKDWNNVIDDNIALMRSCERDAVLTLLAARGSRCQHQRAP